MEAHITQRTIKTHSNFVTHIFTLHVPSDIVIKALWTIFIYYIHITSPGPTLLTPFCSLLHYDLGLALFSQALQPEQNPYTTTAFPKAAFCFRGYHWVPSMRNLDFSTLQSTVLDFPYPSLCAFYQKSDENLQCSNKEIIAQANIRKITRGSEDNARQSL